MHTLTKWSFYTLASSIMQMGIHLNKRKVWSRARLEAINCQDGKKQTLSELMAPPDGGYITNRPEVSVDQGLKWNTNYTGLCTKAYPDVSLFDKTPHSISQGW